MTSPQFSARQNPWMQNTIKRTLKPREALVIGSTEVINDSAGKVALVVRTAKTVRMAKRPKPKRRCSK